MKGEVARLQAPRLPRLASPQGGPLHPTHQTSNTITTSHPRENKEHLEASLSLKKFMVVFYVGSARSEFTEIYQTHFETPVVDLGDR